MSASISIYTIAKDVTWVAGPYYNLKPSEIKDTTEQSNKIFKEIDKEAHELFTNNDEIDTYIDIESAKRDPLYPGHWSDNLDHDTFYFTKCNKKTLRTRNKRMNKYQKQAKELYKDYIQNGYGKYCPTKFLVLDEVFYRQGWFFTKQWFKKDFTMFYAFNKEDALKVLNYIDRTKEDGKKVYEEAVNKINDMDQFILRLSW